MSVSTAFNLEAGPPLILPPPAQCRRRRLAPFSLRLTGAERARLVVEAAGVPLGAYLKAKALGEAPPRRTRRTGLAVEDRQALAQALALLGRSRLASNLNQLAHAANMGLLPPMAETNAVLAEALDHLRAIRCLLLASLGLKAEATP